MQKRTLYTTGFLAVAFMIVISSCIKGGGGGAKKSDAKILFVNAAVNSSALDFYLDSAKENTTAISYGNITPYADMASGSYTFKATIDSSAGTIIDTMLTFADSTAYSLFVVDTSPNYSLLVLNDTIANPPTGMAYVRFVDLIPNSPTYNIGLQGASAPLASTINFKGNSGYIAIAAGTPNIQLMLASNGTVTSSYTNITLTSGKIYTIAFVGVYGFGLNDFLIGNL